jgi:hypothetical protein
VALVFERGGGFAQTFVERVAGRPVQLRAPAFSSNIQRFARSLDDAAETNDTAEYLASEDTVA